MMQYPPTPHDPVEPDASEPIRCELRCTRCDRTANYEVPWATMHPDAKQHEADGWDGVVLGRIIECRACGAEDEYMVSPLSKTVMLLRALAEHEHRQRSGDDREGRLVIGVAQLGDGTLVRRPSQAIAHLRALTQAQPESGVAWRRLGNAFERYDRIEQAEEAWRKAITVDRTEFEAAFSLAKAHFGDDRLTEGFAFLNQAIERFPRAKGLAPELRGSAAACMVGFLRAMLECADEPIALMASWSGGEMAADRQVVHLSSVDLRMVRNWDGLTRFIAATDLYSLSLTPELPTDEVTQLDAILHGGLGPELRLPSRSTPYVRSSARVGRNEPCPCGSDKKFKKCCGNS